MLLFRIALAAAWLLVAGLMVKALAALGSDGGMVFITDFAHPWRAQFNADFSVHILLAMGWIAYRERHWLRSPLLALPALMGGVYLLPYIFVASFTSKGRFDKLLLGKHMPA